MGRSRVYVGGIPRNTEEWDLEDFFKGYGRIREILIKRRFAFVEFDGSRNAKDAIYELDGKKLLGVRVTVDVARGEPKGRDRWSAGRSKYGTSIRTKHSLLGSGSSRSSHSRSNSSRSRSISRSKSGRDQLSRRSGSSSDNRSRSHYSRSSSSRSRSRSRSKCGSDKLSRRFDSPSNNRSRTKSRSPSLSTMDHSKRNIGGKKSHCRSSGSAPRSRSRSEQSKDRYSDSRSRSFSRSRSKSNCSYRYVQRSCCRSGSQTSD
ncbi:uncharacterized protein [Leptinotarsa decemlineata]|uniref:uncharacterized protein n=1 Tax=Leptinotarsa decemlineata TaxID=7539 RepID=UPI003D307AD9